MTIIDSLLVFDPAATLVTVTAVSTNVLDLAVARDLGAAPEGFGTLEIACYVGTAFAAAGAGTLTIQVQGSVDNITFTTMAQSDALGKAVLTAGAKFDLVLPSQAPGQAIPHYLRLNYVVATGPFTAGSLFSFLSGGLEHQPQGTTNVNGGYASGFAVAN